MITDYQCPCGIRMETDIDKEIKCKKCGKTMELIYKKEWTGSVENGFNKVTELKDDGSYKTYEFTKGK